MPQVYAVKICECVKINNFWANNIQADNARGAVIPSVVPPGLLCRPGRLPGFRRVSFI